MKNDSPPTTSTNSSTRWMRSIQAKATVLVRNSTLHISSFCGLVPSHPLKHGCAAKRTAFFGTLLHFACQYMLTSNRPEAAGRRSAELQFCAKNDNRAELG